MSHEILCNNNDNDNNNNNNNNTDVFYDAMSDQNMLKSPYKLQEIAQTLNNNCGKKQPRLRLYNFVLLLFSV